MSKVAIVGVEGSGKTVLMAALGDKYSDYDEFGFCLSPENADAFGFVAVQMDLMRRGQWPMNTDPHAVVAMNWKISRRRGADSEGVSDLTFLDFGGEIYRRTFGDVAAYDDAGDFSAQCEALRSHVQGADALIVLVNMSDVLDGDIKNRRVREACWLSKGILDEATRNLGIKNVAIAFTQADAYRDIIEREEGIRNVYRRHPRLRHVSNVYPALPVFAVSAVNRTFVDGKGIRHPAPDFKSEGLSDLMEWIIGCVPGQERTIPDLVEAPMLAFGKALNAKNAYLRGFGGKREQRLQSLADAEAALAEMDAAMARCSRRVPDKESLVALQAEIASCRTLENEFDSILDKVTAKSTTEAEGALATLAESNAVVQTNMNAFKRDLADRQTRLRAPIRAKRTKTIAAVISVLLAGAAIWGVSVKYQHDKKIAEIARIEQEKADKERKIKEAREAEIAKAAQKRQEEMRKKEEEKRSALKKRIDAAYEMGQYNLVYSLVESANNEDVEIQLWLCTCFDCGIGTRIDRKEAARWLRKAADQNDVLALERLADCYRGHSCLPITKDEKESEFWFVKASAACRKLAEQGHANEQYKLGGYWLERAQIRHNHRYDGKDPFDKLGEFWRFRDKEDVLSKSRYWYHKAVEQFLVNAAKGDIEAQQTLAECYAEGNGVDKDKIEAAKWCLKIIETWRKAAEAGDAIAAYLLGDVYEDGGFYGKLELKKDEDEAAKWYLKAAAKGHARAQYKMGRLYAKGKGVEKNLPESAKWFLKSAEQGYYSAWKMVAACYVNGDGVERDLSEARRWFLLYVERGSKIFPMNSSFNQKYSIGNWFAGKSGVVDEKINEKDTNEAVRWWREAAREGCEDAKEELRERNLSW